jgi:hypothetical protein
MKKQKHDEIHFQLVIGETVVGERKNVTKGLAILHSLGY